MAFWVDDSFEARGHSWCHLAADTPTELEEIRKKLGLKRNWLHMSVVGATDAKTTVPMPHYDLRGDNMRQKAIAMGALQLSRKEGLQRLKIAMLGWKLKRVQLFLEELQPFLNKHEPCGYYCDESMGHVDHKFTNWLSLLLDDKAGIQNEMGFSL